MSPRVRRRALHLAAAACMVVVMWVPQNAPATIAEQRARLPPAAECADEFVAGVWRSHDFTEWRGEWYVFTLVIRRVPDHPEQLVGQITSHFWRGSREDEEPPVCRAGGFERTVSFEGRGTVRNGNEIAFGGVGQWRLDSAACGGSGGGYNLDNFTGVIDPSILEFQSVNNDGGAAVNDPTVFRRIRCPPMNSAESPTITVEPPSFYPDSNRGGCGLF